MPACPPNGGCPERGAPPPRYDHHLVAAIVLIGIVVVCVVGLWVTRGPGRSLNFDSRSRDQRMHIGPFGDPGPNAEKDFEPPPDY